MDLFSKFIALLTDEIDYKAIPFQAPHLAPTITGWLVSIVVCIVILRILTRQLTRWAGQIWAFKQAAEIAKETAKREAGERTVPGAIREAVIRLCDRVFPETPFTAPKAIELVEQSQPFREKVAEA